MRVTAYGRVQIGRGTKIAGPRIALPNNPHTIEFWQAYKAAAGSETPSGRTFDTHHRLPDVAGVPPAGPGHADRLLALPRHRLKGVGRAPGQRRQAEARHRTPRDVGNRAGRRQPSSWRAQDADQLGHPTRVLRDQPVRVCAEAGRSMKRSSTVAGVGLQLDRGACPRGSGHAVLLARYTGQRQADVLRMSKNDMDGRDQRHPAEDRQGAVGAATRRLGE